MSTDASLILVSSMATRAILNAALEACRLATGVAVHLKPMGGVDAAAYVRSGGLADIVLLAEGAMTQLAAEGHVVEASLTRFARSRLAFAVPERATRPDLSSLAGVRAAMLAARAVCYSTGPSGDHLKALWAAWGIADAMAAKAVQAPPGVPVARLVAEGAADLGLQQVSELIGQPGIALITDLPEAVQAETVFTGGVAATARHAVRAAAVLAWLASKDIAPILHRHGMAPA